MAVLFILGGLVLLLGGGEVLVRGAVKIASRFRISPMVIGLTIVSFGTSAPELLVSVQAALQGSPDLSIGNVIGSNIANLALVLGLTAIVLPIPVTRNTIRIDWPVMFVATLIFWLMIQDLLLSLWEGIILVVLLVSYLTYLFLKSKNNPISTGLDISPEEAESDQGNVLRDILFVIAGCLGLVFGADFLVKGATELARSFGVSEHIIGVTVVAFGTSVPELATSLIAAFKKELDISVGNLIGSNIFNIMAILGITAIVTEIPVNPVVLTSDIFWVLGVSLAILPLVLHRFLIHRWKGFILLSYYILYISLVLL
ncbi:MAG: calcium/sodium antiporter [Flavobacteriales bacterium]|nr:calcium/sodium antiporter [Flavobacteriales bacterium]